MRAVVYARLARAILVGAVLAVVAAVLLPKCEGPGPHPFTQQASVTTIPQDCPPGQTVPTCFRGRVIMWDPAGDMNATGLMIEDGYGAPMAWVNLYGLYSGGDGGKDPGGLVCVTYRTAASVACLTPQGTLTLTPAGPDGPTGPTQTLTARDIRWIHAHGG